MLEGELGIKKDAWNREFMQLLVCWLATPHENSSAWKGVTVPPPPGTEQINGGLAGGSGSKVTKGLNSVRASLSKGHSSKGCFLGFLHNYWD